MGSVQLCVWYTAVAHTDGGTRATPAGAPPRSLTTRPTTVCVIAYADER